MSTNLPRQSTFPGASTAISPTVQNLADQAGVELTPTQLRLLEKQQEHAGLQALKEASGDLLKRVEELARMGNVMADGGEAVGSVLRNWPHVFSILNLFDKPTPPPEAAVDPDSSTDQAGLIDEEALAEREKDLPQLVRLQFGNGE